jgi:hypothetical protein
LHISNKITNNNDKYFIKKNNILSHFCLCKKIYIYNTKEKELDKHIFPLCQSNLIMEIVSLHFLQNIQKKINK